jgi:hypothetical protein
MAAAPDRVLVVLPEEDRAIAKALEERLGLGTGAGGRSAVIRHALRELATRLGLLTGSGRLKKKSA